MVSEYIDLIQSVGFPIFVAGWFMLRTEKVIDRNTAAYLEVAEYIRHKDDKENS